MIWTPALPAIGDFHPLVFFYMFGFLAAILGLGLGIAEVVLRIMATASPRGPSCPSRFC